MENPESKILEKLSDLSIDRFHEKMQAKMGEEEVKMDQFADHYGEEAVKKDKGYIQQMEKTFDEESTLEEKEN